MEARVINLEQLNPQYISNPSGEKTAVILPIAEFCELLEDLQDLAVVAERQDETTIDHDTLRSILQANDPT